MTKLTMVVYPRSMAGLNLNSKQKEKDFQFNNAESLLRRIKFETFLNRSGWDILTQNGSYAPGSFDFEKGKSTEN